MATTALHGTEANDDDDMIIEQVLVSEIPEYDRGEVFDGVLDDIVHIIGGEITGRGNSKKSVSERVDGVRRQLLQEAVETLKEEEIQSMLEMIMTQLGDPANGGADLVVDALPPALLDSLRRMFQQPHASLSPTSTGKTVDVAVGPAHLKLALWVHSQLLNHALVDGNDFNTYGSGKTTQSTLRLVCLSTFPAREMHLSLLRIWRAATFRRRFAIAIDAVAPCALHS